jgi:hypothetical protein
MVDINIKKAAMFGLDARIALAIFGALSVISGAALYSAILQAKAISIIADMKEVGKAWEQYYLDTGFDLPLRDEDESSVFYYSYKTAELVSSTVNGWKGPYLSYPVSGANDYLSHSTYTNILMEKVTNDDWSDTDWSSERCNTSGDQCFAWVSINGINSSSIANKIDEIIDGGDGAGSGDFRWIPTNLSKRYSLKIAPIKNPND